MTPYRSRREEAPRPAPTTGIVSDMVRQFADPYAFFRELVQNGIDAGATAIDVSIERLPDGFIATSVADDGCGMTRAIIEGPLLTLFSSSKEGDTKKIGKYGVGFVSIFALDPDEVQVSTGRDGESWLLRLFRDHSYELEVGGPRSANGTKVTLLTKIADASLPAAPAPKITAEDPWNMKPDELLERASEMLHAAMGAPIPPPEAQKTFDFGDHTARSRAALKAWCRHAQIPITLNVFDAGPPEVRHAERIDAPLTVESPISVTERIGDEVIVVGVSAGSDLVPTPGERARDEERSQTFAGFYNRGLTLFETDQVLADELRGIRFKVMSPRLQHTLSRDNVRRDGGFDRLMEMVRETVDGPLKKRLVSEVARAAELASKGEEQMLYAALLEAAQSPSLAIKPRLITFPLADPLPVSGERTVQDFSSHLSRKDPLLTTKAPDALTGALARAGVIVVRCDDSYVQKALRWCSKYPIEEAHNVYVLVNELGPSELMKSDHKLCDEVCGTVEDAGQPVSRVALCRLEGSAAHLVAVVVPDEEQDKPRVYERSAIRSWWRSWSRRRVLLLNTQVETIEVARQRAAVDPALAGHLLARSLLLRGGESIPVSANESLLERAGKGIQ